MLAVRAVAGNVTHSGSGAVPKSMLERCWRGSSRWHQCRCKCQGHKQQWLVTPKHHRHEQMRSGPSVDIERRRTRGPRSWRDSAAVDLPSSTLFTGAVCGCRSCCSWFFFISVFVGYIQFLVPHYDFTCWECTTSMQMSVWACRFCVCCIQRLTFDTFQCRYSLHTLAMMQGAQAMRAVYDSLCLRSLRSSAHIPLPAAATERVRQLGLCRHWE